MKRKFKLITTIASLTAAIALLMFGVYAAANRQVTIDGNVVFTANKVDAVVSVWQGAGADATAATAALAMYDSAHEFRSGRLEGETATQLGKDYTELGLPLNDEGSLVYTYQIRIQNDGAVVVYYKLTVADDEVSLGNVAGVSRSVLPELTGTLAANAEEAVTILTITYTVDPEEISDLQTFNWDFSASVMLATTADQLA